MKYTTEKIRGINFEIEIDPGGLFFCKVDGDTISDVTLDGLKKKLMEHSRTKQKGISIPFVMWQEGDYDAEKGKVVKGVCVGVHAGNDNLMVRLGGGAIEQFSHWRGNTKVFPPECADKLKELRQAHIRTKKELDEFTVENNLNLRELVAKAMKNE